MHGILPLAAVSFTPYEPTNNWTYHLEAVRAQPWPSCTDRFLSFTDDRRVGLSSDVGPGQEFTLVRANGHRTFYIKQEGVGYIGVAHACANTSLDVSHETGFAQQFRLVPVGATDLPFEWAIEALGRTSCSARYASFASACHDKAVSMGATALSFRLHGVRGPTHRQTPASARPCADPFAWHSAGGGRYFLTCTGGQLGLEHSKAIGRSIAFSADGTALGGQAPPWASSGARWAPENVELVDEGANAMFFSDSQASDGRHRVGWAMSSRDGPTLAGAWGSYSRQPLALGESSGGEIDQHVFRDTDGATQRRELLNSSGLWWAPSFVRGGSLIEGPEMVRRGGYYYLFFAAGRYCTASYAEGVARASSVWGPFEKLGVPLLSTGITGSTAGGKLTGPGHASFVTDSLGLQFAVYHASEGLNCQRYAFVSLMRFTSAGWPYIDFEGAANATHVHDEGQPGAAVSPVEQRWEAAGCRIVAPCEALADEPGLRVGEPVVCAGLPCRRLGERRAADEDAVMPVCAVASGGVMVEDHS